jgi:hypothetical protein
LNPVVREHYLEFIARAFPDLLARYERAYRGVNAPREYQRLLTRRIQRIRATHAFEDEHFRPAAPSAARPSQLRLPA